MRYLNACSLQLWVLVLLLAGVRSAVFPGEVFALGGVCGGATPCECGDTVVSDKMLSGSDPVTRSVCPGVGLFLLKEVVLDLNGHTLKGNGAGPGIATRFSSCLPPMPRFCSFGQVIRGGTISGFGVGIGPYTDTMNDTRISRMRIIDSDFFGVGLLGFGNVVEHTLIEGGRHAVFIQGNRNTLQRMTIRDTVGIVAVTLSSDQSELGNVIRDNRIEDTRSTPLYAGEGIWVSGAHNTVARNVVVRSVGDGIVISSFYDEAVKNTVNNNLVDFTGGNGLKFEGREHSLFRNVTRNNAQNGLRVEATSSTLDRNQSFVNFGYGIDDATAGGGTAGTDNTYALNICYTANVLGPSSPAGLCR